jgi:hypothetical protein
MGHVAYGAAGYLAAKLDMQPLAEVPPGAHFDPGEVQARSGIIVPSIPPRTVFSGWHDPGSGRDLAVLLGDRQPTAGLGSFGNEVLAVARELGVERVFTFAAIATPVRPEAPARVFAAATEPSLLEELTEAGAEPLLEGEISGMNGVFPSIAARAGIPGACLLGEFPYFASAIPNPKASAAVLRTFARVSGVEIDLEELEEKGAEVAEQLARHLRKLEGAASGAAESGQLDFELPGGEPSDEGEEQDEDEGLAPADAARIESLFQEAGSDRSKAIRLKAELDRLGVFDRFEDRFLDLFKQGE